MIEARYPQPEQRDTKEINARAYFQSCVHLQIGTSRLRKWGNDPLSIMSVLL